MELDLELLRRGMKASRVSWKEIFPEIYLLLAFDIPLSAFISQRYAERCFTIIYVELFRSGVGQFRGEPIGKGLIELRFSSKANS